MKQSYIVANPERIEDFFVLSLQKLMKFPEHIIEWLIDSLVRGRELPAGSDDMAPFGRTQRV